MKWIWACTCAKCGREVADGDELAFRFKRDGEGWVYDKSERSWTCPECAKKEGGAE